MAKIISPISIPIPFPFPFGLRYRSLASIQTPGSLISSDAALSPRRATHLSFASPKESKPRKGDPGACVPPLRYGQPAVLASSGVTHKLACGSDKYTPLSVWPFAPRRIHKGWGRIWIRGALSPLRGFNAAILLIAVSARIHWASGLKLLKFGVFRH